ncbi:hypothetical protein [Dietzia psychralcaliphila]|uniref:hypothetical protein n=1 Tax=Dietzia psychralcaliphila TaxID=139021 RepID=UPI0011B24EF8|nr:hypothetical protein [Dietzia psychralcaliphila]
MGAQGLDQWQEVTRGVGIQTGDNASFSGNFVSGNFVSADNSDYREIEMSRARPTKTWLPDNWLATVAAAVSIVGSFINQSFNHQEWSLWLTLALLVTAFAGLLVLLIRSGVARSGAVPLFGVVFEKGPNGDLYKSVPLGKCPHCGRPMTVQRVTVDKETRVKWVCASGVARHSREFDPTEFNKIAW